MISCKEAAEILGVTFIFVADGLQQERLPIGTAVHMGKQWRYHISEKLLREYIGDEKVDAFLAKRDAERGGENEEAC